MCKQAIIQEITKEFISHYYKRGHRTGNVKSNLQVESEEGSTYKEIVWVIQLEIKLGKETNE